jgi:hypothetical protein
MFTIDQPVCPFYLAIMEGDCKHFQLMVTNAGERFGNMGNRTVVFGQNERRGCRWLCAFGERIVFSHIPLCSPELNQTGNPFC